MDNPSPLVQISHVKQRYGSGDRRFTAVEDVNLSLYEGEFVALLGPSGCGKTTLLNVVAGFLQPTSGRVLLDGREITELPPHHRQVNTIFQSYALFPHMTVRDNIGFGLAMAKRPKAEIRAEVDRMLELIRMGDQAGQKPGLKSTQEFQHLAAICVPERRYRREGRRDQGTAGAGSERLG